MGDPFRRKIAIVTGGASGIGITAISCTPSYPAVLEQRNARIHRLGQSRSVQIITMVAANSYEEQVLAAYQKLKNDEATIAKAKKAVAIALTLLDEDIAPLPNE